MYDDQSTHGSTGSIWNSSGGAELRRSARIAAMRGNTMAPAVATVDRMSALPAELARNVGSYLSTEDLSRVSQTSRDQQAMYRPIVNERYGEVPLRKFADVRQISQSDREGLVLLGADGEGISNWVIEVLQKENISRGFQDFTPPFKVVTTGGRVDLVLPFANGNQINFGRLAMWRLQMGDASWVSDYVVNYATQHRQEGGRTRSKRRSRSRSRSRSRKRLSRQKRSGRALRKSRSRGAL